MPDLYAVIGNPIAHSKSPLIHAAFAQQTGENMQYEALLAPLHGFTQAVADFRAGGGRGLNVTVPFKLQAWQLATQLTERAAAAQAVNTLRFDPSADGVILGDNTDGAGLVRDITVNLQQRISGKRVLLMGAGGAARGVLLPLLQQQPAVIAIANRSPAKAQALQQQFAAHGHVIAGAYADFAGQQFDLIINATSASLSEQLAPLADNSYAPGALAYDMMYGKDWTPFLRLAQQQGAACLADGTGMLVEQAAESFFVWRGIRPETNPVIKILKK